MLTDYIMFTGCLLLIQWLLLHPCSVETLIMNLSSTFFSSPFQVTQPMNYEIFVTSWILQCSYVLSWLVPKKWDIQRCDAVSLGRILEKRIASGLLYLRLAWAAHSSSLRTEAIHVSETSVRPHGVTSQIIIHFIVTPWLYYVYRNWCRAYLAGVTM